jgi:hypothetical protein
LATDKLAAQDQADEALNKFLTTGDISLIPPGQQGRFLAEYALRLGLDPLTQPFEILTLNGKKILYAKKSCSDQLRKINGISIEIVKTEFINVEGQMQNRWLLCHVRATMEDPKTGKPRSDEDYGMVDFGSEGMQLNGHKKAVTQAKRRVTLSICGLGLPDESELGDFNGGRGARATGTSTVRTFAAPALPEGQTVVEAELVDLSTGEILETASQASQVPSGASNVLPSAPTLAPQPVVAPKAPQAVRVPPPELANGGRLPAQRPPLPKIVPVGRK